ncbi:MAG: YidC/Oxa1 family membrane protein insertase [Lachnospiraceae bacterium]|jgi:YidC/Oxa1 family membrane protein insertase|nr:YidC/Oxa1 family membrane protein insertase [Lachnospiraceae bacterium]MDE6939890.1 YidC/Oxa1 family membrane protein insertase [Lachnospiraceae bacterium]
MDFMLLTQNSTPIFKYIVKLLGLIMNGIFEFLNLIGIPNIGLSIILFTIVIYLLLMPLTVKQQKFSKLQVRMNPEIQAIQAKYKGKQDQASMLALNQETKAVYAKYGVSPSGSCIQLLIQMPILFALYRVIYAMPAYVTKIGEAFGVLADKIMQAPNGVEEVKALSSAMYFTKNFDIAGNTKNAIIDTLNKTSTLDMTALSEKFGLADLTYNGSLILTNGSEKGLIDIYNNFLGLNIGNSPMDTMKTAFAAGNYLLLAGAIAIPVLAAVTQWINYKLMPQAATNDDNKKKQPSNDTAEAMQQSMKMMNTLMPIMSAWFCLTLPAGMGLYWVIGAVVRSIQQVAINKHIDKMDIDAEIEKNVEKYKEKLKKQGIDPAKLQAAARTNTKSISSKTSYQNSASKRPAKTDEEKAEDIKKATEYYNKNAKPGSLSAKANMVKQYNEKK